jgi:hypothetical protein
MLRKLLAAGVVFVAGYVVGVKFGFRAAVVDYVEGDAEKIEQVAKEIYPSPEEGARTGDEEIPDEVGALLEKVNGENSESEESDDGTSKGFQ